MDVLRRKHFRVYATTCTENQKLLVIDITETDSYYKKSFKVFHYFRLQYFFWYSLYKYFNLLTYLFYVSLSEEFGKIFIVAAFGFMRK